MALKVLAVDDSRTIRMIVKKAFRTYNCELFEAENGVEGLAAAAREKPDLIILDITMPVMSGVEMLDKLKTEKDLSDIPVIMLTAESGKDNVTQIVKKGVKDYIVKPFKGEDLIARVQKVVNLHARNDEDADENGVNRYFTQIDDIVVLNIPSKVTRPISAEVGGNLQSKINEMAKAQVSKLILNLGKVAETNVSLIKLIIGTLNQCQKASVAVKVVANSKQGDELKGFQETSGLPILNSIDEAKAAL